MRLLIITLLLATAAVGFHVAPPGLLAGTGLRPYTHETNSLRMAQPMFTKLGDSPYLTGRAALVPGYQTEAITFDYSGTEVAGIISPPADISFDLAVALNYPCITQTNNRNGNLMSVFLDGQVAQTIDLGSIFTQPACGKPTSIPIAYSLSGNHTVRIVKITEPNYNSVVDNASNNITFIGFDLISTEVIPLLPLPAKKVQMEFIGDSITCGYRVNCNIPHDPSVGAYTLESVLNAYSGLTCANLDAQCHYVSWSGRGMAFNLYDSSALVSTLYNYTMATVLDTEDLWDFSYFTPQIVVINLGTNDFDNPIINKDDNKQVYVQKYADVMWQIANQYGLSTSIVTICGPMTYSYCQYVQNAGALATQQHPEMTLPYFVQLALVNSSDECGGHPDAQISITLAQQLTDFITSKVIPNISP